MIYLGTIKGLNKPKLQRREHAYLVILDAIEALDLTLDDDAEFPVQGALLDRTDLQHQRIIQQVQAFRQERSPSTLVH